MASTYNPDVDTPLTPASWTNDICRAACEIVGTSYETLRQDAVQVDASLAERWYASGEADFSLYDTDDYVVSMLGCWRYGGTSYASSNVTRLFMRWLAHRGLRPASFLDYHGGLGLTAAQLSMGHPSSRVLFHTAVPGHAELGRRVLERLGLTNVGVVGRLEGADVLVAQEAMEHFAEPVVEVRHALGVVSPSWYLDQSSFTIDACGHFRHNRKVGRAFNDELRSLGYETYWRAEGIRPPFNAKPAVWVRGARR